MKIPASRQSGSRTATPALPGQASQAPAIPFAARLKLEGEALREAALDKLYRDVLAMAERISLSSPLSDWECFRQGVAAYLAELKKRYRSRSTQISDRLGNQRRLLLIEQVDQALVALGMDFIDTASDNLAFLASLKRLTGLLLDIRS